MASMMMQSLRSSLRSATAIARTSSQHTASATSQRIRTLATSNSEFLSAGPHKAEREYERAVRQAREVFHNTRTKLKNTSANQESLSQALNQLNHDVALAKQRYLFATLNNHREA